MFAIRLINRFQDSYNQQHPDGLLSEFDVFGPGYDEHTTYKFHHFDTVKEIADRSASLFIDSPELTVVEV